MSDEKPNFEVVGSTAIKCDVNPLNCPVRVLRKNPFLKIDTYMCKHLDAPDMGTDEKSLMIYRTCVTSTKLT